MTQPHSPTPWRWVEDTLYAGPELTPQEYHAALMDGELKDEQDRHGTRIIETDSGYYPPHEADRAFIVLAVNSYESLQERIAQLEAALREIADYREVASEGVNELTELASRVLSGSASGDSSA